MVMVVLFIYLFLFFYKYIVSNHMGSYILITKTLAIFTRSTGNMSEVPECIKREGTLKAKIYRYYHRCVTAHFKHCLQQNQLCIREPQQVNNLAGTCLSVSALKGNIFILIKLLLLSHHHSACALVSEILESVLQTVQKQFTYRQ